MHPKHLLHALVISLIACRPVVLAEEPAQTGDKVILLPELAVTGTMKLRPEEKWIHTQIGGFDIYSDASKFENTNYLEQFHRFYFAFNQLFPTKAVTSGEKVSIILCGSDEKYRYLSPTAADAALQPRFSHALTDPFSTYQIINLDIETAVMNAEPELTDSDDADLESMAKHIQGDDLLRRAYLLLLFKRHRMEPPAWLAEGVTRYFTRLSVGIKRIEYGRLGKSVVNFFRFRGLMPLQDFFAITYDSPEYNRPGIGVFSQQAFAFVHWGMFANKMKYQKAFLEFVNRASHEPVSEALLKQYFKMSYKQMEEELRDYVSGGSYRSAVAPKAIEFPPLPKFQFTELSDAESSRLQGDILRILKRPDDARLQLMSPLMRKHADPRLLGALGQLDFENGQLKTARKFLDEAVTAKVDQPAPYVMLARLLIAKATEGQTEPQLTANSLIGILTPLYSALSQKLVHPDVYLTIADAWLISKNAPTLENLSVLDEGVLAFPRNTDLIYKNAVLKARHGYVDDARSLIELGQKISRSPANQNRFSQLKATLPAPAAGGR